MWANIGQKKTFNEIEVAAVISLPTQPTHLNYQILKVSRIFLPMWIKSGTGAIRQKAI